MYIGKAFQTFLEIDDPLGYLNKRVSNRLTFQQIIDIFDNQVVSKKKGSSVQSSMKSSLTILFLHIQIQA